MALLCLSGTGRLLRLLSLIAVEGETLGVARNSFYASLHCVGFAVLGALVGAALRASKRESERALGVALLVLGLYAGLLEGLQTFVPNRMVDPLDFLANLAGAGFGLAVVWRLTRSETPAPPA
jgi:VanZ family protein